MLHDNNIFLISFSLLVSIKQLGSRKGCLIPREVSLSYLGLAFFYDL